MNREQANHLVADDRVRVLPAGLERHALGSADPAGTYVSQFDSPKLGRLVVIRLDSGETRGFRLDEVELRGRRGGC